MLELSYVSYLEDQNGINEAIYLLEESLKKAQLPKVGLLRLLFLYWYMQTQPAYLTNNLGQRDWSECFLKLWEDTYPRFAEDPEFNWVTGYLLSNLDEVPANRDKGKKLITKAVVIAPNDKLSKAVRDYVQGTLTQKLNSEDFEQRFNDWGLMGEYFRYILI